jgi:hypothetical protein
MYRWIQIPEEESNALEKQGAVASYSGYGTKILRDKTWLNTM